MVLLIGATGRVGRQVVAQLPARIHPRALVRDPGRADLPPQVEVVAGDLTRPETLDDPLHNIDAVFLVWTAPPATIPGALDRILKRADQVVFLSAPYKTAHPLFQAAQPNLTTAIHSEIERRIETSGCRWTFLRPGMFAANALSWWAPQIRAGADVIRWPYASAPTAPIHESDIAAVAVRALCDEGHDRAEYILTGPQSLMQSEQLSIIGDAIGRPLRMEDISPDEARREVPFPQPLLNMLLAAWGAAVGQPALVTSTVAGITESPARTFHDWATDHASDWS
jgi:uncharacterized protein YbjT (DUF2867 family)